MWQIYEKKNLTKIIHKLPKEILKHYELWKQIVELEGPQGLRLIKGYYDEALRGEWQGYRSSRLNLKWRIIYKIEQEYLEIYVIEITPHKY
jgi:addiction module RelE/StbE family toxin